MVENRLKKKRQVLLYSVAILAEEWVNHYGFQKPLKIQGALEIIWSYPISFRLRPSETD